MPTYAFGFAIYHPERGTGMEKVTINNRINIHVSTNLYNQSLTALPFADQTLSQFQSFFSSDYLPSKIDILAVPFPMDFIIENWGLLVINQNAIVQPPVISAPKELQNSMQAFAHQVGLNWFENVITVAEWRHIWLTRGLNKLYEYFVPSQNLILREVINWSQFGVRVVQEAFRIDDEPGVQPMERDLETPVDINGRFDDVISFKSAAVLQTIRNVLSNEAFDGAVKRLIEEK